LSVASEAKGNWPAPAEAPAFEDLARCVHCGLCVNACPTYVVTGLETESPRGRIFFARGIAEGELALTEAIQGHWELCLQCRACEAVCPSGVPYGRIQEHARAQLEAAAPANRRQRRLRKLVLRNVIARPRILALAMAPARWLASSRLRPFVRRSGLLRLAGPLGRAEPQLPREVGRPLRRGDAIEAVDGASTRAVLFTGCVMGELFGEVHRATARVLARRGVQAVAPKEQACCGALHAHDGDLAFARKLARKNIDGLERYGDAPIVVNSAGCGAAMKEYGDLLAADPKYAARARAFSARVKDATEFVAALEARPGRFEARVTYQDPCHLAHAQRIREQPRALLAAIEGCDLIETQGADLCCGAAGLYSLVQPEMSAELRARKAEQFALHRPDVVATANPGCQMQYEAAVREAGLDARVMHVMQLVDQADVAR
jgi:glycolate oxidase iron-sulfur subunit